MAETLSDPASSLYEQVVGRMLTTSQRVTTAAEGKALLAPDQRMGATAEHVQKVAVLAVPILRALTRGSRLSGVPWPLVASTTVSVGLTLRAGLRELQVLGSLLADRIERVTGRPADDALVKKLAVELYLAPDADPDLSERRLQLGRLVGRWLFRGALGRETGKSAQKALEAAERLDVQPLVRRWAELPAAPARGAG